MRKILFFVCAMLTWLHTDVTAKTLVVYYSYTGNCREIVTMLTSQMEADVLEIQPAEKGTAVVEPDGGQYADIPVQLWSTDGWQECRPDSIECQQRHQRCGRRL